MRETGEENRTRESINEKPPELDEEMWEENRKIIDIVDEKTFQPGLRTGKEKPRFVVRGGTLVEEGLGRNKVLFSSQRGRTANGQTTKCRLPDAPCVRETDLRPPAGFWLY